MYTKCIQNVFKMYSKCIQNVFKMYSKCIQMYSIHIFLNNHNFKLN